MTIANWILLGALVVTAGLLIFSYIKKNILVKKITESLIIPLFGAINVLILWNYLPDSLHLIKITIAALSLVTISTIFISCEQKKPLRISGRILVLAAAAIWISLYRTIFFIHKVPLWLSIIMIALYLAGLIISIILSGKQEFLFYAHIFLKHLIFHFPYL